MKRVITWLYCISSFCISFNGMAQEASSNASQEAVLLVASDSIIKKKPAPLALRFGVDLYKPILFAASKDYSGLELVGDLVVYKNFYAALEIGSEEKTIQSEQTNFSTKGTYFKVGFDYNMFENSAGMNNQVYVGLRYGKSIHSQTVNNYSLYSNHHSWPETLITDGSAIGERSGLSASWFEVVLGIKVQVLNNFYMGLSVRLHRLLKDETPDNFDNLYIPGFNKKTDENSFGAGFNYTLTYSIPIRFKKG